MFSDPQKIIEQARIEPGQHVADLGAGAGFYSLPLARTVGPYGRVYAVEIQDSLLTSFSSTAQSEGLGNIEVIWGDVEEIGGSKLGNASVDVVVIANTMFQVSNKKIFLDEACRILKQDGKIIFVDWTDSHGGLGPSPDLVFPKEEALALFKESGLTITREIDAGEHHYGMILIK
jgi:ubiquinone/menaquinone biosynthesis C-methylase UbiE